MWAPRFRPQGYGLMEIQGLGIFGVRGGSSLQLEYLNKKMETSL